MDVGVRELKQHLSEYLDRAARGEAIRVTDRGVPKALITALPGESQLERGIEEGWVRPPVRGSGLAPASRSRAGGKVLDTLRDDRGG